MHHDYGDFLKDEGLWTRGGIDAEQNQFTSGTPNAWRLRTPLPLPSMTKLIFTVPAGAMARAVLCQKNGRNTGDVNLDYSFDISSTKWRLKNYEIYGGNEDTNVMFVVAFEDGRDFTFAEMPVKFYRPEKDALPTYWLQNLEDATARIEALRQRIDHPVELFYLTDIHWTDNAQRSPTILNHLSERLNIKHIIFGGDMIVRYNRSKPCAAREITGFFDWLSDDLCVFTTLGNHDRNYSSGNTDRSLRFSEPETYDLYMKRAEKFAVMEGDPSHGYFDFPDQKVRMVQFYLSDSMFGMPEDSYVDGALDWAEQKILELDGDWTVLLFTHAYSRGNNPDGSYVVTEKNKQICDRILKIKQNAKAELVLWVTGHIHVDTLDTLSNGDTDLQIISVLSDGYKYSNAPAAPKMRVGTDTEQAIDCMQIDLPNRTIYCTRIGAGDDRVYHY